MTILLVFNPFLQLSDTCQRLLNPRHDAFFSEDLEQVVEAWGGGFAGHGQAAGMHQHAGFNSFDSESTVNFPAMADTKQMDDVPFRIKGVNYPVITDPQSVAVVPFQSLVWKSFEPQSHLVNLRFNASAHLRRQLEESSVKWGIADLQRCAHAQGWRTRGRIP